MFLKNNEEGRNNLERLIFGHYDEIDQFSCHVFRNELSEIGDLRCEFLLSKKHVVRYSIGPDDKGYGAFIGGIELAIGPYYFGPRVFWSYENGERFSMDTTPEAIEANLRLLDEFLGVGSTQAEFR